MFSMNALLWYVFAGSKGGLNRARIVKILEKRPLNANQLASKLELDYKTVTHHLKVLHKNELVHVQGNGYGNMYFISKYLSHDYEEFEEIYREIQENN